MSVKTITARIPWHCDSCGRTIQAGEKYEFHKSIRLDSDHGYFESWQGRQCLKCAEYGFKPWLAKRDKVYI